MSPKDKINIINSVEVKIHLPAIAAAWFGSSVLLGWLLSFITQPFDLIKLLYSNYQGHIERYNIFCLVMIVALFLTPLIFLLSLKNGFSFVSLRSGGGLIFSIFAVLGILVGLGAVGFEGKNKFSQIARGIVHNLDWLGAALISFIGLYLFVSCIVVILKNGRNH